MPNKTQNRRSLKNLVIHPGLQLRLVAAFFLCLGFICASILGIFYISISANMSEISKICSSNQEIYNAIADQLSNSYLILSLLFLLISVLSFAYLFRLSHRVFGSLVPILRHIENLKNHNYDSKIQLRKGDAHLELMTSLNQLAEELKSRKS